MADTSGGANPKKIERLAQAALWPQVRPGSRAILFSAGAASPGPRSIAVLSLRDQKVKMLIEGASYARYLSSGHLAFVDQGTLFIIPFNFDHLEVAGNRIPLLHDVAMTLYGSAEFDVSQTGELVFWRQPATRTVIRWFEEPSRESALLDDPADYSWPSLSPNGKRIALVRANGEQRDLRIYHWRNGKPIKETVERAPLTSPVWMPDGRL